MRVLLFIASLVAICVWQDANNHLTNIQNGQGQSIVGLGYDAQGNLQNKNGQEYAFDFGNRLRQVAGKESYRYDAHGRRVSIHRTSDGRLDSMLYGQSGQLLYEWSNRRGERTDYIYLAGSLLAKRNLAADDSASVRYQHTDALGSPVAVSDASGQVVDKTLWRAYGEAIDKPAYDGVGYTGHVMDGATGLTYMQQRYYDPEIGRLLSGDPVSVDNANGGNFNRYWYANNTPYRFTDPDGGQSRDIEWEYRRSGVIPPSGGDGPNLLAWGVVEVLCGFCDLNYSAPFGSGELQPVGAPWEVISPSRGRLSLLSDLPAGLFGICFWRLVRNIGVA